MNELVKTVIKIVLDWLAKEAGKLKIELTQQGNDKCSGKGLARLFLTNYTDPIFQLLALFHWRIHSILTLPMLQG
jgi:hypothetical protein